MTTDNPPEFTELVPLIARCNQLITALVKTGYRVDAEVDNRLFSVGIGLLPRIEVNVYRPLKLPSEDNAQ